MTEAPDDLPLLTTPAGPVGPPIDGWPALEEFAAAIESGSGPVALDTERAGSFRYHAWAYLLQFKTPETGIRLVDPIALAGEPPADLALLDEALSGREWILHAASQDLPCLTELGLHPRRLFDTELAARLAGRQRVGLGPLVEDIFGVRLLKEHGAADWSQRPLPRAWLDYAALDVELLHELRDILAAELEAQGKWDWAQEEFQHWIDWSYLPVEAKEDPWRRTAGLHQVHSARGLALVRELWTTRDEIARELDMAPGRVLNDRAIALLAAPVRDKDFAASTRTLNDIDYFHRRVAQRFRADWIAALDRAEKLPQSEWPPYRLHSDGPPATRGWAGSNPPAAARWEKIRPAVDQLAAKLGLPPENLIQPDALRRVAWAPAGRDAAAVDGQFEALGARRWQRELVVPVVVAALAKLKKA